MSLRPGWLYNRNTIIQHRTRILKNEFPHVSLPFMFQPMAACPTGWSRLICPLWTTRPAPALAGGAAPSKPLWSALEVELCQHAMWVYDRINRKILHVDEDEGWFLQNSHLIYIKPCTRIVNHRHKATLTTEALFQMVSKHWMWTNNKQQNPFIIYLNLTPCPFIY